MPKDLTPELAQRVLEDIQKNESFSCIDFGQFSRVYSTIKTHDGYAQVLEHLFRTYLAGCVKKDKFQRKTREEQFVFVREILTNLAVHAVSTVLEDVLLTGLFDADMVDVKV